MDAGTTDFIMQDIKRNVNTKPGDTINCIKCKKDYKRGNWNFYDLCDDCFNLFDEQKMIGRFSRKQHYESVQEWINNL